MPARDWIDYAEDLWPKLKDGLMDGDEMSKAGKAVYDEAIRRLDKCPISNQQAETALTNRALQTGYPPKFADVVDLLCRLGSSEAPVAIDNMPRLTPADYARAREERKAEDEFIEQQLGGKTKAELGDLKTKAIQAARTDWERKTLKGKDPESSFVLRRRMARLVEKQMESTHVE